MGTVILYRFLTFLFRMFIFEEDSNLCWFNPSSFVDNTEEYRLVGIIIGLALYNTTILDIRFPTSCFRKLLGVTCGLDEVKILKPFLGRGLQQILDYKESDLETVCCLYSGL